MVERKHLAHCIPLRIELVVKGTVLVNHCFQGGKALILLQIGLFSEVEGSHVSLKGKTPVLAAGASSTFFPCETCVMF
jgi:hypothetical protein